MYNYKTDEKSEVFTDDIRKNMIRIFQDKGNEVAIVDENKKYTYNDLYDAICKISGKLISLGIKNNDLVAIFMDKSADYIVMQIAIIFSGAAFIPLNKKDPNKRINQMLESSGAVLMVTDDNKNIGKEIKHISFNEIINSEFGLTSVEPGNLAYVIYTSGTTGQAKGVIITLKNLVTMVNSIRKELDIHNNLIKNVGVFSVFSFDLSIGSIYYSLFTGRTLVIVPERLKSNPDRVQNFLCEHKVDIIEMTPTYLDFTIQESDRFHPKIIILCGEPLSLNTLKGFFNKYVDIESKILYNMYGPTETCVFATSQLYTASDIENIKSISIGKALSGYKIYILNDKLKNTNEGQIYIGGKAVSKGYLNREDLNIKSFLYHEGLNDRIYATGDYARIDIDGRLEFLGRNDQQFKVNGFRIEIGDIESNMINYPDILQAKVFINNEGQSQKIIAYYHSKKEVSFEEFTEFLMDCLPVYMVPNYLVPVERFNYNMNAKLDKKSLPNYKESYLKSKVENIDDKIDSNLKRDVLNLIREVLSNERISLHDSFYFSGGNSLFAFLLTCRIESEFGVKLPTNKILSSNSIKDIVCYISNKKDYKYEVEDKDLNKIYETDASSLQNMLINLEKKELLVNKEGYPAYNLIKLVEVSKYIKENDFRDALTKVINSYDEFYITIANKNPIKYKLILNSKIKFSKYYEYVRIKGNINEDIIKKYPKNFISDKLPLIRFWFIENENKEQYILINAHHAIFDYYGFLVILNNLFANLEGRENIVEIEYMKYLKDRIRNLDSNSEFWNKYYLNRERIVQLNPNNIQNAEKIRSNDTFSEFKYEIDDIVNIRSFSHSAGITEYFFLFLIFSITIYSYTAQEDIIIGTFIPGRGIDDDDMNVLGSLLNVTGVRFKLEVMKPFLTQIKKGYGDFNELLNNSGANSIDILKYLDKQDLSKGDLFKTLFNYESELDFALTNKYNIKVVDLSLEQSLVPFYLRCFSSKTSIHLIFKVIDRVYKDEFIDEFCMRYNYFIKEAIQNPLKSILDIVHSYL